MKFWFDHPVLNYLARSIEAPAIMQQRFRYALEQQWDMTADHPFIPHQLHQHVFDLPDCRLVVWRWKQDRPKTSSEWGLHVVCRLLNESLKPKIEGSHDGAVKHWLVTFARRRLDQITPVPLQIDCHMLSPGGLTIHLFGPDPPGIGGVAEKSATSGGPTQPRCGGPPARRPDSVPG